MMPRMLRVGLTGNIGSGKSQAALVFAELGAHIIDADVIGHELLKAGTGTHQKVVQAFGASIVGTHGDIDRKKLGSVVFGDPGKREALNRIVHPDVHEELMRRIDELEENFGGGVVMVDAALLVESGHHKLYDRLVVVTCEPALQLNRIIHRDGLSEDEAKSRIAAQMPVEEKLKVADYTIETSGTFKETREQIEAVYRDLLLQEIRLRESG